MTTEGQDLNELFDIMPIPETRGILSDPVPLMIANKNGIFKTVTRKQAHAEGFWHRSIGLWLFTKDGKVVIQKRSEHKDTNPGKWQMSVAGHVTSGHSVQEAVLAEASEELGLDIDSKSLQFIAACTREECGSTTRFGEHKDREYKFVFMAMLPDNAKLDLNPGEIDSIEFRDLKYVFDRFEARDPSFCPMDLTCLKICREAIEKHIKNRN